MQRRRLLRLLRGTGVGLVVVVLVVVLVVVVVMMVVLVVVVVVVVVIVGWGGVGCVHVCVVHPPSSIHQPGSKHSHWS